MGLYMSWIFHVFCAQSWHDDCVRTDILIYTNRMEQISENTLVHLFHLHKKNWQQQHKLPLCLPRQRQPVILLNTHSSNWITNRKNTRKVDSLLPFLRNFDKFSVHSKPTPNHGSSHGNHIIDSDIVLLLLIQKFVFISWSGGFVHLCFDFVWTRTIAEKT